MFEKLMEHAGLEARPQQTALVDFARAALDVDQVVFVQAGTGTGKSYAVLATAMEYARDNKMPSVVVAPTNALVTQYVTKDAVAVQAAIGGTFAYLKGRSNYLCTASPEGRKLKKDEATALFMENVEAGRFEWAQAGLPGWGCTNDCSESFGDLCAMRQAKEAAGLADVIVTNGHVLIWDLKVEQMTNGVSKLLPAYGALFVDECHELDAVAKGCSSDAIGPNSDVYDAVLGLQNWVGDQVKKLTKGQTEMLINADSHDEELAAMVEEATREAKRLRNRLAGMAGNPEAYEEVKEVRAELKPLERFIDFANSEDDRFISTLTMERGNDGLLRPSLNRKCIDSSSWTRPILSGQGSVLVSGTIPPSLPKRLGVGQAVLQDVGTPFHYKDSVLAISPFSAKNQETDWKRAKEVAGAVVDMASRSHEAGGGGSLILFTSWKDMDEVMPQIYQALKAKLGADAPPVFTQSKASQQETAEDLAKFKAHGHAVMGGVQSLWTGVDVPGPALRQVVIYRLPWGVPNLEVKAIEAKFGRQPYTDDMMTRLVQGIGRLVRQVEDNGRVFIADSRAKQVRWNGNSMAKHVTQFTPFTRKAS